MSPTTNHTFPSKTAHIKALLGRPDGVTMAELVVVTGWQSNTVSALLTYLRRTGRVIAVNRVNGVRRYSWGDDLTC